MKRRSSTEPPELLESPDSEEIEDPSLLEARADEEAALEISAAEADRAAGELDMAAQRYRRVAQLLIDVGDDARAVSFSRLASEMAALEDARRPSSPRAQTMPGASRVPPWERDAASERARALAAQASWPAAELEGMRDPVMIPRPPEREEVSSSAPAPMMHPRFGYVPPGLAADPSPLETLVAEAVADLQAGPSRVAQGSPSLRVAPSSALRPSHTPRAFVPARILETEHIAARLSVLPLFAELEPAERVLVARQTGLLRFRRGDLLCEAGAPAGPLMMLVEGAAYVALPGRPEPTAFLSAGDIVGEFAAYFGGPRTATVLAQDHLEALSIAPTLVRALARGYLSVRAQVEETARDRARESLPFVSPLLRRLDSASRADICARLVYRVVAEGEALFVEGEDAACIALVAAGEVELYGGAMGPSRGPYARVGEALGVTSVLLEEPAGLSARAVREALVATLPADEARALAQLHPRLYEALEDVDTPGRGVAC